MSKNLSVISTNLKSLRDKLDLSQGDLALLADVSERAIRDIEKGKSGGSIPIINKLSKALKVSVDDLFTDYSVPASERGKVRLTLDVAEDLGIDYKLLQKISSLGESEMSLLIKTVDTLYELSSRKQADIG